MSSPYKIGFDPSTGGDEAAANICQVIGQRLVIIGSLRGAAAEAVGELQERVRVVEWDRDRIRTERDRLRSRFNAARERDTSRDQLRVARDILHDIAEVATSQEALMREYYAFGKDAGLFERARNCAFGLTPTPPFPGGDK